MEARSLILSACARPVINSKTVVKNSFIFIYLTSERHQRTDKEAAEPAHHIGIIGGAVTDISNLSVGNSYRRDGIICLYISWTDNAGQADIFITLVDGNHLLTSYDHIAVGQDFHHRHTDIAAQQVVLFAFTFPFEITLGTEI